MIYQREKYIFLVLMIQWVNFSCINQEVKVKRKHDFESLELVPLYHGYYLYDNPIALSKKKDLPFDFDFSEYFPEEPQWITENDHLIEKCRDVDECFGIRKR